MSKRRKLMAQAVLILLAAPAIMIFNDNYETVGYNIIGLAYAWLMIKYHRRILPGWIIDYINQK